MKNKIKDITNKLNEANNNVINIQNEYNDKIKE